MRAAARINGDYLEDDIASMEAMSARDLLLGWSTGAPAYAAALTAEEQRRAAAPLTEPVAPEGVTVRTVTDCRCTYVSINRGCHDDLIATVWHSDARAVSIENEYATPEALRFVADLADYRAAQHAAGEQQRKIDAVRAAEEVVDKARRVEDEAATDRCIADNNWETAKRALTTALDALKAAKREAGL